MCSSARGCLLLFQIPQSTHPPCHCSLRFRRGRPSRRCFSARDCLLLFQSPQSTHPPCHCSLGFRRGHPSRMCYVHSIAYCHPKTHRSATDSCRHVHPSKMCSQSVSAYWHFNFHRLAVHSIHSHTHIHQRCATCTSLLKAIQKTLSLLAHPSPGTCIHQGRAACTLLPNAIQTIAPCRCSLICLQTRASIKDVFPARDCFALIRPLTDEGQLAGAWCVYHCNQDCAMTLSEPFCAMITVGVTVRTVRPSLHSPICYACCRCVPVYTL